MKKLIMNRKAECRRIAEAVRVECYQAKASDFAGSCDQVSGEPVTPDKTHVKKNSKADNFSH